VSFCHHLASVVHRLFLIGRFLKNLLWNRMAKWNETW
jgi:hypothetical protein